MNVLRFKRGDQIAHFISCLADGRVKLISLSFCLSRCNASTIYVYAYLWRIFGESRDVITSKCRKATSKTPKRKMPKNMPKHNNVGTEIQKRWKLPAVLALFTSEFRFRRTIFFGHFLFDIFSHIFIFDNILVTSNSVLVPVTRRTKRVYPISLRNGSYKWSTLNKLPKHAHSLPKRKQTKIKNGPIAKMKAKRLYALYFLFHSITVWGLNDAIDCIPRFSCWVRIRPHQCSYCVQHIFRLGFVDANRNGRSTLPNCHINNAPSAQVQLSELNCEWSCTYLFVRSP